MVSRGIRSPRPPRPGEWSRKMVTAFSLGSPRARAPPAPYMGIPSDSAGLILFHPSNCVECLESVAEVGWVEDFLKGSAFSAEVVFGRADDGGDFGGGPVHKERLLSLP